MRNCALQTTLITAFSSLAFTVFAMHPSNRVIAADPKTSVTILDNQAAWKRMPAVAKGEQGPLPAWIRGVAGALPRSAAALVNLDHAQRVTSPLDPILRAQLRAAIAKVNRCPYNQATAERDLIAAGGKLDTPADPDAIEFVTRLSTAAPEIPDALFAKLVAKYGDRKTAAMVLLAAYSNFQDRVVWGLNLANHEEEPLPPLKVEFAPGGLQVASIMPPQSKPEQRIADGSMTVKVDTDWTSLSYDDLQKRLEQQRQRQPRLPIPTWEQASKNLPPEMAARPTSIVWSLTCIGYAPELHVPWTTFTRTLWSEFASDRIVEESLFWVQTRAIGCNYCMGHCEMLLEVAGLSKDDIARRTKELASNNWSSFPPAEQRAYAYAQKLTRRPWELTPTDYQTLRQDWGDEGGMATFLWLCRGLYMTRISDGFQLPLERENVFAH